MILRDIDIVAARSLSNYREFNFASHCVSDMYLHYLPKVRTRETTKIIVELSQGQFSGKMLEQMLSVTLIRRGFDFGPYWSAEKPTRRRITLNVLHEVLLELAGRMGWPLDSFKKAYEAVIERNLVHEFFVGKPAISPDRKRKARVWCSFDEEEIKVYAIVFDRAGQELSRHFMRTTSQDGYFLYYALGEFGWLDNETLILVPKTSGKSIEVKVGSPGAKGKGGFIQWLAGVFRGQQPPGGGSPTG